MPWGGAATSVQGSDVCSWSSCHSVVTQQLELLPLPFLSHPSRVLGHLHPGGALASLRSLALWGSCCPRGPGPRGLLHVPPPPHPVPGPQLDSVLWSAFWAFVARPPL